MPNYRMLSALAATVCLLAGATTVSSGKTIPSPAADQLSDQASNQAPNSEQAVWKLEHAYWDYVQDNNVTAYLDLWHKNLLGWPRFNAAPVGKDHITDWINSQTAKGLIFKSIESKPARIQVTGDTAVACYWITYEWLDKDGKGQPQTSRIIHTWLRDGTDKQRRIIGGMSMPESTPLPN